MATYTVTLSRSYPAFATYHASSISYDTASGWSTYYITSPKWNSGRKRFRAYNANGTEFVSSGGAVVGPSISSNKSATEQWTTLAPALMVKSNGSYIGELVYDAGVWYSDYANRVAFDAEHPMPVPTRECYRFLGLYSADNTTSTKYVNADGTPTEDFPASISADATIYAQWELVSVKITITASNGDWQYKTFYQSKTADGDGKYGYYTDSTCPESARIYGIPVPTRELYAWGGLHSTSSSSSTLYASADGSFTSNFLNRTAAAATVYGNFWTQVSYKITLDTNGGTAEPLAYYTNKTSGGIYTDWLCATTALTSLPIPAKNGSRFLGYFSADSGGTKYVEYDGVIQSALNTKKATTTIHAQWRAASYTVSLLGVSEIIGSIYYDATAAKFFDAASATITSVPVPVDPGNVFLGYYTAPEGGDQVIDATGAISQSYAPTGNDFLYAQFSIGKCTIVVDAGDGEGGTAEFFYDIAAAKFYADTEMMEEITSVTLPTRRLFDTLGLYDSADGGTQVVAADGSISQSFAPTDASVIVYAHYSRNCYELDLDPGDGYADLRAIFRAPGGSTFYADPALTDAVSNVGVPVRDGYTFGGYTYDNTTVISNAGEILAAAEIDDDVTATAVWTANTYTLSFNANGGTASFASKTVTYGVAVGQLPTCTRRGFYFGGWYVGDVEITTAYIWNFAADKTAVARWRTSFGDVTDFFGLASARLVPFESNEGLDRPHVVTRSYGKGQGASAFSSVQWRNPTVRYMVVGNVGVGITLGAAFGGGGSKTGYMITSAQIETRIGEFPVLTVSAVANEGVKAINTFSVSVNVLARARPQNLMNAVGGGGQLQALTLTAVCDPVVLAENQAPCASDVVNGRVEVSAETLAPNLEGAPGVLGGFELTGLSTAKAGTDYTRYSITGRKEIY